ncbi:BZ3500_MvSof-1268-A1-R1_C048g00173 [Microbotryum saponariae]|uniref:BZ3500_MvSof-1268-A1-R1_C048g00173 protein n=1 Tax=Microbotryum saponariae TaxID=289078 RepID=A0A2X0KHD2_9BASI|nr:BZ3500_MvSof-1268-A1-R1_Chr1-1g00817 [Microbotryum saponariae]SCZ92739.1 BZ3501_MvSof-1269-A2-R1_Chr1-1g00414 [Microbotryum saponariae]SCZ94886.1 BZ3500_MvSof-1268-A1-R1_C048g00173 [Microbotryum saponariae]
MRVLIAKSWYVAVNDRTLHSIAGVTNGSFATPSSASQHPRHPRDLGLPALRTSSPRFGTCTAFFSSNYTLTTLSPPTLT